MKKRLSLVIGYFIFAMAVTVFLLAELSANLRNPVYLLLITGAIIALTSLYQEYRKRTNTLGVAVLIIFFILIIKIFYRPDWLFIGVLFISMVALIVTMAIRDNKDKEGVTTLNMLIKKEDGAEKLVLID